jgi:UDP-N-acetyl-L-fucosamine synthase
MKKLKIVPIVGKRPEIIRLACVFKKFDQHCEHIFIHKPRLVYSN